MELHDIFRSRDKIAIWANAVDLHKLAPLYIGANGRVVVTSSPRDDSICITQFVFNAQLNLEMHVV